MKKIGFIGWRGIVGATLIKRMQYENDFSNIEAIFFSTSAANSPNPFHYKFNSDINCVDQANKSIQESVITNCNELLYDAYDTNELMKLDCIIATQGSEYTKQILPKLRDCGYTGYWLDASSYLRTKNDAIIVLDPLNYEQIITGINNGIKNFVGGNCAITLVMMGLAGLLKYNLIEYMNINTYQAISGAGANHIRELITQMAYLVNDDDNLQLINNPHTPILKLLDAFYASCQSKYLPIGAFNQAIVGNILPWIDEDLHNGSSREEAKGEYEANKILDNIDSRGINGYCDDINNTAVKKNVIKIDGMCVRVPVLQSHSAIVTFKLDMLALAKYQQMYAVHSHDIANEDNILDLLANIIKDAHPWINFIDNNKIATLDNLTPLNVTGSLQIAVGRLKKLNIDENLYSVFITGDQLLWGASEPLRRMLKLFN